MFPPQSTVGKDHCLCHTRNNGPGSQEALDERTSAIGRETKNRRQRHTLSAEREDNKQRIWHIDGTYEEATVVESVQHVCHNRRGQRQGTGSPPRGRRCRRRRRRPAKIRTHSQTCEDRKQARTVVQCDLTCARQLHRLLHRLPPRATANLDNEPQYCQTKERCSGVRREWVVEIRCPPLASTIHHLCHVSAEETGWAWRRGHGTEALESCSQLLLLLIPESLVRQVRGNEVGAHFSWPLAAGALSEPRDSQRNNPRVIRAWLPSGRCWPPGSSLCADL